MTAPMRVLGAASSYSELAFVYFEGGNLRYWGIHRRALQSIEAGFTLSLRWIGRFDPMLVIVPDYGEESRKGQRARALVEIVAAAAADKGVACIRASRPKPRKNKYEEAALLALIFPQLAPRVPPPRKAWDPERRGVILFEAVGVTHTWLWQNREGTLPLPF